MIGYEGRVFQRAGGGDGATVRYHQSGQHVWAEVMGGPVVRGALSGRCGDDGTLDLAYALAMDSGDIVAGQTTNVPEVQADGTVLLREEWRRVCPDAASGVSYLEQIAEPSTARSATEVSR